MLSNEGMQTWSLVGQHFTLYPLITSGSLGKLDVSEDVDGGEAQLDTRGTENCTAGLEKNQHCSIIQKVQQFYPKGTPWNRKYPQ